MKKDIIRARRKWKWLNKKLEKDLEQKELDIDILKKASAILMKK